jgi:LPS-assembly protein
VRALQAIILGLFLHGTAHAQSLLNMQTTGNAPIALSSDEASCTNDKCIFLGHVMLTSGTALLSANALNLQMEQTPEGKRRIKYAVATGDVLLIDGNNMTTCERIELNGDLVTGTLGLAEIRVKKPGSFDPKLAGFDALGAGTDALYMSGEISRTGERTFLVKNAYFTPCDCGKGAPPIFSVRAKEARVELGSHAVFIAPVLQPGDVALPAPFALPALYVPLSKRKTGLLPPAIRVLGPDGVYVEDSFFLVLGPSMDMTALIGLNERRGVREMLEFRYNPSVDIEGGINVLHMFDTQYRKEVLTPIAYQRFLSEGAPDAARRAEEEVSQSRDMLVPNRVSGRFWHRSGTFGRTSLRLESVFYTDAAMPANLTYTVAAQALQYTASRLVADHRGDDWRVSAGAAIYQDFAAFPFFGAAQGRVLQRIPDLGFSLAPLTLPAGFRLALDARMNVGFGFNRSRATSYDAQVPSVAQTPAETEALLADCARLPTYTDGATLDAYGQPAPLSDVCAKPQSFARLDVVPRLSRPFSLGALQVRPELFGLFAAGFDSLQNTVSPRGFVGMKVELSTLFGRVFKSGDALAIRHRIRPMLTYLLIPGIIGARPRYVFDERDQFQAAHQLVFGFETDLFVKAGSGVSRRFLTLSLYQQLNLGFDGRVLSGTPFGFGSLVGKVAFQWNPLRLGARTTYDLSSKTLTEQTADIAVADNRGNSVGVSYLRYTDGGTARMNTGLFELAPGGAVILNPRSGALHIASFAATVQPLKWLGLNYSFGVGFGDGIISKRVSIQGQKIGARLTGACDCFGVEVDATFLPQFFQGIDKIPVINVAITVGDYTFRPQ